MTYYPLERDHTLSKRKYDQNRSAGFTLRRNAKA